MAFYHLVLCLALSVTVSGVVIQTTPCEGQDESSTTCTVSEVRIDPCRNPSGCIVKKRTNSTISFDFTPKFSSPTLTSMVYWSTKTSDTEFGNYVSKDTCTFTPCPTVAGTTQTFNYHLYISKYIPKGVFPLKWKVWNEQNPSEKCCFLFSIQIIGK